MSSMIINEVFLFDTTDEKAKKISFTTGKNIVTESKEDASKRGKSTILRSIYHTLGAECFFEGKWDKSNKTSIVKFTIDDNQYYICRRGDLFQVFSTDYILLFTTARASSLADYLSDIYKFSVKLPSRNEKTLVTAPPAFSYLLNFIDQDHMSGSKFCSFDNLGQFDKFKENVIYRHLKVFTDDYYQLKKEIELLETERSDISNELKIINSILDKINNVMKEGIVSNDFDSLKIELEKKKQEYSIIINTLAGVKNKLINLRNEKFELDKSIFELVTAIKTHDKDIVALKKSTCPTCQTNLESESIIGLISKKYNISEDYITLSNEIGIALQNVDENINKQEAIYKEHLIKLENYKKTMSISSKRIDDIMEYQGYMLLKDQTLSEWDEKRQQEQSISLELKEKKNKEKEFTKRKQSVNEKYYELMLVGRDHFKLEEIENDNIKNIKRNFRGGGSNNPIATIVWHLNLLKLKREFNPNALIFPLIVDSPTNAEMGEDQRKTTLKYLFDNVDDDTQLITSILEFDEEDYSEYHFDNIIRLDNRKYCLLNKNDYCENRELLEKLTLAGME